MSRIVLSPKAEKLMKLCELEGYKRLYDLLKACTADSVCPAICMTEGCDYTTEMEPDQDAGPVEHGLVQSLSRPGGNVTGLTMNVGSEIFPDQKKESAVAFLVATVAYFKSLGITVERVMTDNGSCYLSKAFARACKQLAVKHIRIKPYTPQTNGKAERFIQTALREWAYATAFEHSEQRYAALPAWLHRYNWHRPHVSLARKPPISRLGLTGDNLLRLHS
jgi:Integrase core domain